MLREEYLDLSADVKPLTEFADAPRPAQQQQAVIAGPRRIAPVPAGEGMGAPPPAAAAAARAGGGGLGMGSGAGLPFGASALDSRLMPQGAAATTTLVSRQLTEQPKQSRSSAHSCERQLVPPFSFACAARARACSVTSVDIQHWVSRIPTVLMPVLSGAPPWPGECLSPASWCWLQGAPKKRSAPPASGPSSTAATPTKRQAVGAAGRPARAQGPHAADQAPGSSSRGRGPVHLLPEPSVLPKMQVSLGRAGREVMLPEGQLSMQIQNAASGPVGPMAQVQVWLDKSLMWEDLVEGQVSCGCVLVSLDIITLAAPGACTATGGRGNTEVDRTRQHPMERSYDAPARVTC
jgi:hypothetical protein